MRIIHELPYFEQPTSAQVHGRSYPVKRERIVLWVSVADLGLEQLDPRTPRIPAILDTGCNHNFVINQQHLTAWAGIHPDYLPKLASVRVGGEQVSQFAANVWLHPNVPGKRDELTSGPPFQLELAPASRSIRQNKANPCTRGCRYWACGLSSGPVCELPSTAIDDASTSASDAGFGYSVEFIGFARVQH